MDNATREMLEGAAKESMMAGLSGRLRGTEAIAAAGEKVAADTLARGDSYFEAQRRRALEGESTRRAGSEPRGHSLLWGRIQELRAELAALEALYVALPREMAPQADDGLARLVRR